MRELDLNGHHIWVVLCKITDSSQLPPVKGVIRVTEYVATLALCSDGEGGTQGSQFTLIVGNILLIIAN